MANDYPAKFRLILHVGAGKTGTTSIQQYLARVVDKLAHEGVAYWGYMLDRAPVKQFPWQDQFQTEQYLRMDQSNAVDQLAQVLEQSIDVASAAGMHTAIWSNEAIFDRAQNVLPALARLDSSRVEVVVIAYVRRHDAWAASAYLQWGLKHKSYSGELVSFRRYMEMRPVRFMNGCDMWRNGVCENFLLRNYDAAGDVISDFSGALGLPLFDVRERANESPGLEEMFFRALFNSQFDEEVLPGEFNKAVSASHLDFALDPTRWLNNLLPGAKELGDVIAAAKDDRDALNQILLSVGQPPLVEDMLNNTEACLETEKLVGVLSQVVLLQAVKIRSIETRLDKLEQAIESPLGDRT